MASRVSVAATEMVPVYLVDDVVGVEPLGLTIVRFRADQAFS